MYAKEIAKCPEKYDSSVVIRTHKKCNASVPVLSASSSTKQDSYG